MYNFPPITFFLIYFQGTCSNVTIPVTIQEEGPGPPYNKNRHKYCTLLKSSNSMNVSTDINNNKNNNISKQIKTISTINNPIGNNSNNNTMAEKDQNNKEHQCLDYLGDKISPAQICNSESGEYIKTKLKELRLDYCWERSVLSALHNDALNIVLNGGDKCVSTLNDLIQTNLLAKRITCEFSEIIDRYDCRQQYSLIHHCLNCTVSFSYFN